MMATETTASATTQQPQLTGGETTPSSAPLPPQTQVPTHSLDIQAIKNQPTSQQPTSQQTSPKLQGEDSNGDKNVSPQELTLFVEKLLEQINAKFDGVSGQIFSKMDEMSSRIEDLEKSIGELVQNADEDPKTPPTSKVSVAGQEK